MALFQRPKDREPGIWTPRARTLLWVTAGIYFLATYSQVTWLYLVVAMVGGLYFLSAFYPLTLRQGLSLRRQVQPVDRPAGTALSEGDSVFLTLQLQNRSLVGKFFLEVREECPLAAPEVRTGRFFISYLPARQSKDLTYEVICYKRGCYRLPGAEITSGAPLDIFRRTLSLPADFERGEVMIYPLWFSLQHFPLARQQPSTLTSQPKAGQGLDLYGTREYRRGDSLSHIHWPSTARTGRLVVKEFEQITQASVSLVLDLLPQHVFGTGRESTLEYAIKIAASVARYAIDRGNGFRLVADNPAYPPDHHSLTWEQVLETLARTEANSTRVLAAVLDEALFTSTSVIILPVPDVTILGRLAAMVQAGTTVVVILLAGFATTEKDGRILAGPDIPAMQSFGSKVEAIGTEVRLIQQGADIAVEVQRERTR